MERASTVSVAQIVNTLTQKCVKSSYSAALGNPMDVTEANSANTFIH